MTFFLEMLFSKNVFKSVKILWDLTDIFLAKKNGPSKNSEAKCFNLSIS